MAKGAAFLFRAAALAAAIAIAGCGDGASEVAELDNQLVANGQLAGNDADPALTSALEDQILVDPALTQQSNKLAARPPASAPQAQYPLPDKGQANAPRSGQAAGTARSRPQEAATQAAQPGAVTGACAGQFNYGPNWARRLPPDFAVYPGARITEAAGNAGDCRVVVFASADAPQRLLDWYRSRAVRAGYSSEHQVRGSDHVLAGTRGDAAYYLIVSPAQRGSQGALIVNQGR